MVRHAKTPLMLKWELAHNQDIATAIRKAYSDCGNLLKAANSLEISPNTLYGWMMRLNITIKKTAIKGGK